jgi:hypothetical protein
MSVKGLSRGVLVVDSHAWSAHRPTGEKLDGFRPGSSSNKAGPSAGALGVSEAAVSQRAARGSLLPFPTWSPTSAIGRAACGGARVAAAGRRSRWLPRRGLDTWLHHRGHSTSIWGRLSPASCGPLVPGDALRLDLYDPISIGLG